MKSNKGENISKQFDLNDRFTIEMGLIQNQSFKHIAAKLGCHPVSISREIRSNRTSEPARYPFDKDCKYVDHCNAYGLCDNNHCHHLCRSCITHDCRDLCSDYHSIACKLTESHPYVCNACSERRTCIHKRYFYHARSAQELSDRRRSESRKNVQIRGLQLQVMDRLISNLIIKKGQPITHICSTQRDEIPICQRSVYNYIHRGKFKVKSSDLRRRNGYKKRLREEEKRPSKESQQYRIGRTYEDFKAFMVGRDPLDYVEMDTVKGAKGSKACLLTLLFPASNFMLLFLLPDGTQNSVLQVFDKLELLLGLECFQRIFPVILTDNGSEFKNVNGIELTTDNQLRTRVFYCDPMASWQKARIEKNHEYIRYVIPKGTNLNRFTNDDITLLMNHINSTARPSMGKTTPYRMILDTDEDMQKLMKVLKIQYIYPEDVNLTPSLFDKE